MNVTANVDIDGIVAQQISEMDLVRQKVFQLEQTQQNIRTK